jgi:hypothetical protein
MDKTDQQIQRLDQLDKLAAQDEIYGVWKNSYDSFSADFALFANSQPEEVRNTLWGYAESGRLMEQRKVLLACAYMDFTE